MKAIIQNTYGSADVLEFVEIDKPVAGDNDVLVRVHAAGLHIGDWHIMTGLPYMLRVVGFGLRAPHVRIRGIDVAGKVEMVGKNVTEFRPGDDVFGTCEGAFAEYACVPESNLALKPANLTFDQAAVVPTSTFAALQALRDRGGTQRGHKVLIVGASGGVGIFAVQIAKSLGAEVTGVCRTSNVDMVHSLGADEVIDHTKRDFTADNRRYDVILDTGGNRSLSDIRRVLSPDGTLVLVGAEGGNRVLGGVGKWIRAMLVSPLISQNLRPLSTKPNKTDLLFVKNLLESGKVKPILSRSFALSEVPDAFRFLKEGPVQGKIVIAV